MNRRAREFDKQWKEYCSETVIPSSVTDEKIAEVERNLGRDTGMLMSVIARPINKRLKECHFPLVKPYRICGKRGNKVHSISKSAFLDVLSPKSYLMHMEDIRHPMAKSRGMHFIRSGWRKIGKEKASVFCGICHKHDELFSIVDDRCASYNKDEYNFLLAFRPIIRYHWEFWDAIYCIKKEKISESNPDWVPSNKAMDKHEHLCDTMLRKWFTAYRMRERNGLRNIVHIHHEWEQPKPSVVFSGVIGVAAGHNTPLWTPTEKSDAYFVLNVLPYGSKVRATISMHVDDYSILRGDMPSLFTENALHKTKDVISSAMVAHSKYLYLSKEYFRTIPDEQKEWMLAVRNRYSKQNNCPVMGDAFFNLLA